MEELPYDDLYRAYCQVYVLGSADAEPRKIWEVLESPREKSAAYSWVCALGMYDAKNGRPPVARVQFNDVVRYANVVVKPV